MAAAQWEAVWQMCASLGPVDQWDDVPLLCRWATDVAWLAGRCPPWLLILQPQLLEQLTSILKEAVSCRFCHLPILLVELQFRSKCGEHGSLCLPPIAPAAAPRGRDPCGPAR